MSSEKWPFLPERLTDVLPEDLVRFIQSGSSVRLRMATAIVELRTGCDGRPSYSHIKTDDLYLNFTWFCKYLRGDDAAAPRFPGGEEACRDFDGQTALEFFSRKIESDPGHSGAPYRCHMGLCDYAAPIWVAGQKVAVILTGQRRPENPTQLAEIASKVHAIGSKGSAIQVASGDKEKLKRLIDEIPPPTDDPLARLEAEAERIARFATDRWGLQKTEREEGFIRSLRICDTAEEIALDTDLGRLLKQAAEWCGVDLACLFVSELPGERLLTKVLHYGMPQGVLDPLPHFNWAKAGLPDFHEGTVETALDTRAVERGVDGEHAKAWRPKMAFAYAISLATEHRAVFCLGRRLDGLDLASEAVFLERLALRMCHPYLERRQFLELRSRKKEWEDATSLIGHQVRGSLQPIRGEADIIRGQVLKKETWISEMRVAKALDAIAAECDILSEYATEALDFWKHRKFERRSLANIVHSCVEGLREFASRETIEIHVDPLVDQLPEADVIGRTLEIAIRNILENAIKYSFDDRYIDVRSRIAGDFVLLEIEDFGIGIPEAERQKVFLKGYRGQHRGRKTEREGEGLGTWQARDILRAHGGEIECTSRAGDRQPVPGDVHGFRTIFTLKLPVNQKRIEEEP